MRVSALASAELAERFGQPHDRIILSAKVSDVRDLVAVYRALAAACDFPLHLGLTEAGLGVKGVVATTAALSILLFEGIGDTISPPRPAGIAPTRCACASKSYSRSGSAISRRR